MAEVTSNENVFLTLNAINVNEHTETKDTGNVKLTYLSWAWAWAEVKKKFPDANYEIVKFEGLPYVYDEKTGYMVYTTVTIKDVKHEMWLPVMDGNNRSMKAYPYELLTKSGKKIPVAAATMFDINKTIMRCLTKNLAMFGLGLYIYAGEDLPETDDVESVQSIQPKTTRAKKKQPEQQQEQPAAVQPQQKPKSEIRIKLKELCVTNDIDQKEVIRHCGLNESSTDADFEKAYDYALELLASKINKITQQDQEQQQEDDQAGQLPFEV